MHPDNRDKKDRDEASGVRVALISAAAAVVAAILGVCLAKLLDLSIHEVEELTALTLLVYGLGLILRWGIHLRLNYLNFGGRPGKKWDAGRRRKLTYLTVADGSLALTLTVVGWYFFTQPGHLLQLGVTVVMLVAIWWEIEATRETIEVDGPPCGADVIERCAPFRMLLDPRRIWNGKWGIDSLWEFVTAKIPVGHRSKVAVFVIVALAGSAVTQAGAMLARRVSDGSDQTPGNSRHHGHGQTGKPAEPQESVGALPEPSGTRSYVDNCGAEVVPGDGAPEPLRGEIKRAWEEESPADGCAQLAQKDRSGRAFLVPGECRGRRSSLGIVSWEYGAAILLENAALAAREVAAEAEIDGASARADIANGDFQLIYTPEGPYLLIRDQKTDGHGGLSEAPVTCAEIVPGKETYQVLTPGMAELLLRFNRGVEHAWPASVDRGPGGGFDLVSAEGDDRVLAHAVCPSRTECRVQDSGIELAAIPADIDEVTVPAIQEYGPR